MWSGGQIGVVDIDNTLPVAGRLLLPDLDELTGVANRRSTFRVLDRDRVGSVKIADIAGLRDFDFGDLPVQGCMGAEESRPRIPDRLSIRGDRRVGRKQHCVIRIERDGPLQIVSRGRGGPLLIESLDCGGIGRAVVDGGRRSAGRGHEDGRYQDE